MCGIVVLIVGVWPMVSSALMALEVVSTEPSGVSRHKEKDNRMD